MIRVQTRGRKVSTYLDEKRMIKNVRTSTRASKSREREYGDLTQGRIKRALQRWKRRKIAVASKRRNR